MLVIVWEVIDKQHKKVNVFENIYILKHDNAVVIS